MPSQRAVRQPPCMGLAANGGAASLAIMDERADTDGDADAEAHGLLIPDDGLAISHGFAIPVLIALAVGVVMSFLARRTRFGRYVFSSRCDGKIDRL